MGTVTKSTTFVDGTVPTASQFNGDFDTIYNEFNGSIENANIDASAGISESKISFDTTAGHDHDGTDSKKISLYRAFVWYVSGTLVTGTSVGARYVAPQNLTITKCWLSARTAPTGSAILVTLILSSSSLFTLTSGLWVRTAGPYQKSKIKMPPGLSCAAAV